MQFCIWVRYGTIQNVNIFGLDLVRLMLGAAVNEPLKRYWLRPREESSEISAQKQDEDHSKK